MELDAYQADARNNLDQKVLLVAPPGSGKTTVLLAKIRYLVEEQAVAASSILVLTFSRSASQNMKARYTPGKGGDAPFFGTMHAFAYQELKGQGPISLISPQEQAEALKGLRGRFLLSEKGTRRIVAGISRQRSTGQADEALPQKFREEAEQAYAAYKKRQGMSDFDDLEERFLSLLQDEILCRTIRQKYAWIMVDEFQDLNRVQLNILKRLAKDAHLFCVGDEDQCIYAFRGSDTRAMTGFAREFPGGKILYLHYNYRCSATVVRHAGAVIRHNKARYPKQIVAFRQDETKVMVLRGKDEAASIRYAADQLKTVQAPETAAVLVRTNAELRDVSHRLYREGIRFSFLDQPFHFHHRLPFSLILTCLGFAEGRCQAKERFLQLAASGILKLPAEALDRLALSSRWGVRDLLDNPMFGLSFSQRQFLHQFLAACEKLRSFKAGQAVRYVLYKMGLYQVLETHSASLCTPLRELIQEAEGFARQADAYADITQFLKAMCIFEEAENESKASPVLLSTLHGVKGMEFDRVFILNAVEGRMPHERSLDDLEAERRLFYVAVTRARHDLSVLCPELLAGKRAYPSRFALEMELLPSPLPGKLKKGRFFQLKLKKSRAASPVS